ncbi:MAG: hemolysin family protein [Verrucomicrobia bacterium]|nr:hemolysin family protein [Verrucomicrobiota bacterium]
MLTSVAAVLAVAIFAGASFFFALAETSLFALSQWQARQLAGRAPRLGGLVVQLLAEPQEVLATIVLGNTVANAAIVGIGLLAALHGSWVATVWAAIGLLVLILVGCEVVPKALAVRLPEQWALRIARPMWWLHRATRPWRHVSQGLNAGLLRLLARRAAPVETVLTDDEYRELLELGYQQGTLAQSEKEIIGEIINLDRRAAREVMKPRAQMACIPDDLSIEDMIAAARRFKHRRLPIYDETPDTIVGVLNTRALLLEPQVDLAEAIEFPSFVPESMNLLQLLKSLQRQQRGLAIVLDEFGGTAGLVTIEDILAEVVGQFRHEGEAAGFVMEKLGEGRWRVNGTMRLDDFQREYPDVGKVAEVETMGGLLVAQLEMVPAAGQSAVYRGLRLTALAADERRVRELLVETVKKRPRVEDA